MERSVCIGFASCTHRIALRRTLADDSRDPTYIRTVSRHGYQFIHPEVVEEDGRFTVVLHVVFDDGAVRLETQIPNAKLWSCDSPNLYVARLELAADSARDVLDRVDTPFGVREIRVEGPHFYRWDLSLRKNFRLAGSSRLEARVDAFNAFDRVNFNNPNTVTSNTAFGQISSAKTPREMQFSLRLQF